MKKIKVFLGGYINYTNAQNLNCRAIAEHLNKDKFEIYALKVHFGDNKKYTAKSFNCFKPFHITQHFAFLWGILHCDVAYLPKHIDTPVWVLKLAKWLKKPIFTTIEGIDTINRLISDYNSIDKVINQFKYFNKIYPITYQILNHNKSITLENNLLLLGVNVSDFLHYNKEKLSSIVFIGGLTEGKRAYEFCALARLYPNLQFHMIGDGTDGKTLIQTASKNVIFHGRLNHKEMDAVLSNSDLLFLPSISEGFPKVILEAASAGVPSVVYDSYGASDWMDNKKNGFVVSTFKQVEELVNELLENPALLHEVSSNTQELAYRFDWKNIINDWKNVIIDLYNEK